MSRRPRWEIGDRAWWPHRERGETIYSAGRVIGIDDGPRPGVRLRFDKPVQGGLECYATHAELLTERQARLRGARIFPPPDPECLDPDDHTPVGAVADDDYIEGCAGEDGHAKARSAPKTSAKKAPTTTRKPTPTKAPPTTKKRTTT